MTFTDWFLETNYPVSISTIQRSGVDIIPDPQSLANLMWNEDTEKL